MGERQPAKHHAPSRRKRRLSGRKESSSSVFFRAGWPWARADRPLVQFGKRGDFKARVTHFLKAVVTSLIDWSGCKLPLVTSE